MSNYLNDILEERNISKTDFAVMTGINRTTISKLCNNGDYKKGMRIDTAYHISKILDISIDEFIRKMCDLDDKNFNYKNRSKLIKKKRKKVDTINLLERLEKIEKYLNFKIEED